MGSRNVHLLLLLLVVACDGPVPAGDQVPSEVWVANLGRGQVVALDVASSESRVVLDAADVPDDLRVEGFEPSGLALQGERLLVTNFASGDVLAFDPDSGAFLDVVHDGGGPVRLEEPCGIRVDGPDVWVLGNDSWNVAVLSPDRAPREVGVEAPIRAGHGLELVDDLLYVATSPVEPGLGLVQARDPISGVLVDHFAPWPELQQATHLLAGPGDELLVTDWFAGAVYRYDRRSGQRLRTVASGLDGPVAAAWADGLLWVLERSGVAAFEPTTGRQVIHVDAGDTFDWARNLLVVSSPAR